MTRYVLRRVGGVVLTLWAAITVVFFAMQLIPGDPAEAALSQTTVPDAVLEQRREALGLDQPLAARYSTYLSGLLRGDLGLSWMAGQPVSLLIGQQIGPTVALALGGLAVAVVAGGLLGLLAVLGGETWLGEVSRSATGLLLALPVMFTGTLAVWLFAIVLGWLPATGQQGFASLILPSLVVGASAAGGIARTVEAGVSEALRQPFVPLAAAKGLTRAGVMIRHALRVGLLPTLDVIALQFGFLLGGTVVTENLFARQGVGRLLLRAVLDQDLPVVQGVVILSAVTYAVLNLGADVAKAWLDPRVQLS